MITTLAVVATIVTAALSMGCGVSPAYEPEPRVPGGYYAQPAPNEEPMTAEQLAEANAQAHGQLNADIQVGEDSGDQYGDTDPSALTEFKPALEGHGQWIDDPAYGTVWVPAESEVGSDFIPYTTAGHWTYDDAQNYVWVSDYSWGWAPFHYGRWVHGSRAGWAWIPGRTYAGAWVVWRAGDPDYGYVGWAPAGPDWYWYDGYAVGWTFGYTPFYSYCYRDNFYGPGFGRGVIRGGDPRGREIEGHTRPYTGGAGGNGRIAATPGVGPGRTAATPRVGPPPSAFGVRAENVMAPPNDNVGLAHAQTLATPRTAMAAGAAAPVQTRRRPTDQAMVAGEPSNRGDARAPVTSSRMDAVARSPQYQAPSNGNSGRGGVGTSSASSGRAMAASGATPSASRPYYASSSPQYRSAPTSSFRAAPSSSYHPTPSQPSFRSAPSQPTFHSSSSASTSSSFHPSAPSYHPSSSTHSSSSHSSSSKRR